MLLGNDWHSSPIGAVFFSVVPYQGSESVDPPDQGSACYKSFEEQL